MENKSRKYQIPFAVLPLGKHEFEFELDNTFFELFEYGEIKKGSVKAHLLLDKKQNMALFDYTIAGNVSSECDRCLDEIVIPIENHIRMVGKESSQAGANDGDNEDLFIIPQGQSHIDIADNLYELVHLALPMHKECADTEKGECNPEVIAKLNSLLINKNEDDDDSDPRWDALKDIKF